MKEWTKSRFEVAVTPYCRNKDRDDEKKLEKSNNSPSYHYAAIKKDSAPIQFKSLELEKPKEGQ